MSRSILPSMRPAAVLAAAVLGACGASADPGGDVPPDGGGCSTFITYDPMGAIASPLTVIRADAGVTGAASVLDFTWTVTFVGGGLVPHAAAQADGSAITFTAADPGTYRVRLEVSAATCPDAEVDVYVMASGANQSQLRLRITPPASANVPAYEEAVNIPGGATYPFGTLSLHPGTPVTATVQSAGVGVPAYLRLMPVTANEAAVELFTSANGAFSARLLNQPHDVLVIPTAPGHAPQRIAGWVPGTATIPIVAGDPINGVVLDPDNNPIAGAKVQLKIGEIPSTLATTAANGLFTLRAAAPLGTMATVDVTPPEGSGLPRLLAPIQLASSFQVNYFSALVLRDLAGTTIRRQGTPVPGAKVVVVGELPVAGTVTIGTASVLASGVVRIAATAGAGGALPATLVPARQLAAVVEVAPGDHAVTAIDLTSGTPASIDAPPAVQIATQLRRPDGATPISEALFDAVPAGELALAGVTSAIRARSNAGGQVTASLAAGGRYDLRIHDPVQARGAPRLVPGVTVQAIAPSYALRPALAATGKLQLQGSSAPIGGAAVQLLCAVCSGLERSRPLAEGTSLPDGRFTLVVPDPGVN